MFLAAIQSMLAKGQAVTGENIRQAIFDVRNFTGLVPMTFITNIAAVKISIHGIQDGADVSVPD